MKIIIRKQHRDSASPGFEAPKRHPTVDRGARRFDQSQLKESSHGNYVHRDYAAHWFRWGFAARFCKKGARVLDIGCGQDMPLPKILNYSSFRLPELYVGLDLNPIPKHRNYHWGRVHEKFNFVEDYKKLLKEYPKRFTVITCFEVIEHMGVEDGQRLLRGIKAHLADDGLALLSTPVYNGKHMAAAHIHEYRYEELRKAILRAGLGIERVHGTFMSAADVKKAATPEELAVIKPLTEYYSWDVLANFLAPNHPEAADNCCWILRGSP